MFCYAVYTKHPNKQIRVFSYSTNTPNDWQRAEKLAIDFAEKQAENNYPCTVEFFGACSVGKLVYDTDKKARE